MLGLTASMAATTGEKKPCRVDAGNSTLPSPAAACHAHAQAEPRASIVAEVRGGFFWLIDEGCVWYMVRFLNPNQSGYVDIIPNW